MKYFISALALIFSLSLLSCSENKVEVSEDQVIGMRTTAMEFMKDLKGVLITQIQTSGVLQAVSVCSDTAQILTNNFGVQKGVFIKRVSFKNRNENNLPDDFEKQVLNKFELLHQNKELTSETEHTEIVQEGEFKYLRYLKPIFVQAECLNCHGSETDIMPEVKQLIAQEYSNDKAVGYLVGDLRGAVSLKKVIE
ncbi:MAG TPA: DUF3365 domain-containing protein [Ignavibacteriaceae bacterium]|nr:DUF3365 domain-containing protein [Ignavibacteriaceae bacterium]